ncbi:unnamed protein product [Urochloa humidicola]
MNDPTAEDALRRQRAGPPVASARRILDPLLGRFVFVGRTPRLLSLHLLSLSSLPSRSCSLWLPSLSLYASSEAAIPKRAAAAELVSPEVPVFPRLHSVATACPPRLEIRAGISWVATGCCTCYKKRGLLFWEFPGALISDDVSVKGAGIVV